VTSASGLSALRLAERNGFEEAISGAFSVIEHPGVDVVVIATPHDTHAELATMALKAGKHVWCEKPLALTEEELRDVELAWAASGRQLMVGFNRRWSPAVLAAQKALEDIAAPKFLVYRVAAGPVPNGHWYADRRQGGRLLGEVCHFVDTAQALVGAEIEETVSVLGGQGTGVAGNDAMVSMRFADGSLATICYGSAVPTAGKEWIEVSAGSHRLVIDDFRSAQLDGKQLWKGRQDKGHRAQASAFWQATRSGPAVPSELMLSTMRATISAAGGLEGDA
jgi:predicted dehydrogenase